MTAYPAPLVPVDAKNFATITAKAALAGYVLCADPMGGYYVTRWGQMRMFDSLEEVRAWLERVTGKAAV